MYYNKIKSFFLLAAWHCQCPLKLCRQHSLCRASEQSRWGRTVAQEWELWWKQINREEQQVGTQPFLWRITLFSTSTTKTVPPPLLCVVHGYMTTMQHVLLHAHVLGNLTWNTAVILWWSSLTLPLPPYMHTTLPHPHPHPYMHCPFSLLTNHKETKSYSEQTDHPLTTGVWVS